MKIQDTTVQLSASHEASRSQTREISIERDFRRVYESLAEAPEDGQQQADARQRMVNLLQSLIDAILAAIDGKKMAASEENLAAAEQPSATAATTGRREMAWRRDVTETVRETEKTSVCGSGCVRTCDGRQIDIDFSLQMSRDYVCSTTSSDSGRIALRDPLVLSFDGNACQLAAARQAFDLDADGIAEEIPGLGANSAFLVFDRNGNGRADDGSELFGVASGDGFADLATLDSDGNGWIDESDPAFGQLAVWSGDDFRSLTQSGIGALYTGSVAAPFALKTTDNELLGQIRAAGLYLSEAGEVGYMQQVDLAVSSPSAGQQPGEGQQLTA